MAQVKAKWIKTAIGLSSAFSAPNSGFAVETPQAQEVNKSAEEVENYQRIPFWQTEYSQCDSLIIAKHWNLTVSDSKTLIEDKVNYGIGYVIGTTIYQYIDRDPIDLSGLDYFEGHPVSYNNKVSCNTYAQGLREWYYGSETPFTYCDAELISVYYDMKLREGKAMLGNKVSYGLVDNARTYILNPAKQELQEQGYTGTSEFCSFDEPIELP